MGISVYSEMIRLVVLSERFEDLFAGSLYHMRGLF